MSLYLRVFHNYKLWKEKSKNQREYCLENFTFEKMRTQIKDTLKQYLPNLPKKVNLDLSGLGDIKLPKKEKVTENG